jgi:hypothetical protein
LQWTWTAGESASIVLGNKKTATLPVRIPNILTQFVWENNRLMSSYEKTMYDRDEFKSKIC